MFVDVGPWRADRSEEMLDKLSPDAVVVFDAGGKESAGLVTAARRRRIPLRVVDVRRLVLAAAARPCYSWP
jgi:hypothetical protein